MPKIRTHRDCPHCGHRVPWHHVGWTRTRGWYCLHCTRKQGR